MSFAVCVTFSINPKRLEAFLPLMHTNAKLSVTQEPGCQRFDVLSDPARPTEIFLYELYDDAAAFQAHLNTPHFKSFDQATTEMIVAKDIKTYEAVVS